MIKDETSLTFESKIDRLGICANCDSTRLITKLWQCATCGSNSIMIIDGRHAKDMRTMRNSLLERRPVRLLRLLPEIQKSNAKVR